MLGPNKSVRCSVCEENEILTASSGRRVVHVCAWDHCLVAANAHCERWKCGRAREDVASLAGAVLCSRNFRVVSRDNAVVHKEEGGTGVSNGINGRRLETAATDSIARTSELPEAVRCVDSVESDVSDVFRCCNPKRYLRHICNRASVLGGVDEAKVVGAWRSFLEISSEDVGLEEILVDGGLEECGLLLWYN